MHNYYESEEDVNHQTQRPVICMNFVPHKANTPNARLQEQLFNELGTHLRLRCPYIIFCTWAEGLDKLEFFLVKLLPSDFAWNTVAMSDLMPANAS